MSSDIENAVFQALKKELSLLDSLYSDIKKEELEYEKFDGYELPPRTQFSMLNKPAVSIKYSVMKFNMA